MTPPTLARAEAAGVRMMAYLLRMAVEEAEAIVKASDASLDTPGATVP